MMAALACPQAEELGGRPFADPSQVLPMPESWHRQPVRREASQPVDLAVVLDQQLYPAVVPLIEDFARRNKARIATQFGTCGVSSGSLADKIADIGGFCCPPGDFDRLPGLKFHTIGIAAVALIAHPSNPLDGLSLDEARRLFGGTVRSWADLPVGGLSKGAGKPVEAVARLHCRTRPGHWRLLLDSPNDFAHELIEVPAIQDMIMQVAHRPGAIGYETLAHIARNGGLGRVKILALNGIHPTDTQALAEGRYPLYRVFNVTTWAEEPAANPLADRLVAHLLAHAGSIDAAYGIVPAATLRRLGWRFHENEVVGEPE